MSETFENRLQNRRKITLFIIVLLALFVIVYGSGIFVLPSWIQSSYQNENCKSLLTLNSIYSIFYPTFIKSQFLSGSAIMECAIFRLAEIEEGKEVWASSFNAYQVYENTYPNGLLVDDAHQRAASVLINLAKEQVSEKKFVDSLTNLKLIFSHYSDTDSFQVALEFSPQLYVAWGEDAQLAGKFDEALWVYDHYENWAESNQETDHAQLAQIEIAQTCFDWGLQLQSQMKFQEAEEKFESAVLMDPNLTEQVKANKEKFHTEWADFLLKQKDFAGALAHYSFVSKLVEESDPLAAKDVIANGYIQWAEVLETEEDFIGALVLLDFAQEISSSDSVKVSIDEVRTNTYIAFSMSNGDQAQKAISESIALVCKHQTMHRLPIFGTANDNVRAGVYGVDENLPQEITATTPASLHYVVCVEEGAVVVGSTTRSIFATQAGFKPYLFERLQYIWNLTLRKINTGEETATIIIEGAEPPQFPSTEWDFYEAARSGSTRYFGKKPDFSEVVNWLAEALK